MPLRSVNLSGRKEWNRASEDRTEIREHVFEAARAMLHGKRLLLSLRVEQYITSLKKCKGL